MREALFRVNTVYYSNTTSTVVRKLTVLSSTTDKINHQQLFFGISGGMSKFMSDTTNIKIKYKLLKSYVQLVYDEKVSRHLENCHSNRAIT